MGDLSVRPTSRGVAFAFIRKHHYTNVMPQLNKYILELLDRDRMVGVITLGWGVRPLHTIRKLFPSLGVKDYVEIGRLCASDDMPRNTESQFLSLVEKWVKKHDPSISILFTWADGILGKPGYVYQASNFLYGGYIWTDVYFTSDGEKIHPRLTNRIGGRPDWKTLCDMGWKHYRGKQFRYIRFLCSRKEARRLLQESTVSWSLHYPKDKDLEWKLFDGKKWSFCERPPYKKTAMNFKDNLFNLPLQF